MKLKSGINWTEISSDNESVIVLFSYFAPVAVIVNGSVDATIRGLYSDTTNRHIAAFFARHNIMVDKKMGSVEMTHDEMKEMLGDIHFEAVKSYRGIVGLNLNAKA